MNKMKNELQAPGGFSAFLKFEKMITPTIITIIFLIGVALNTLVALGMVITGIFSHYGGGVQVLTGLVTLILGPVFVRIWCELMIVIFKIYEEMIKK